MILILTPLLRLILIITLLLRAILILTALLRMILILTLPAYPCLLQLRLILNRLGNKKARTLAG